MWPSVIKMHFLHKVVKFHLFVMISVDPTNTNNPLSTCSSCSPSWVCHITLQVGIIYIVRMSMLTFAWHACTFDMWTSALRCVPKSFCMHYRLQCNSGNRAMLTQAYIVNPPLLCLANVAFSFSICRFVQNISPTDGQVDMHSLLWR